MQIAYLVNQYPGISHTFIRREIAALERAGVSVARYAIRPSRQEIFSAEDSAEAARTRHIVTQGKLALATPILKSFFAGPARSLSTLALALKMGWRSEAGLLRHFIYWAEAMALSDWLKTAGLRHVHAHFGTNSATVALLAARISGASFSVTIHGPEEFDKPALIALPEKIEAARFVCAVSSYGMSQLRRLVSPEYWDRIKIVRCGIEQSFYAGGAKPLEKAARFVSVGRLCEQKGQLTLIEAAAKLKERGHDFTITLVGDGDMRAALEKTASRLNVRDRIIFAGWKAPAEVRAEIEGARIFVLPSYAEGLPVSIMEAFCLERPVISTYVAGIPELVVPGENGWLAPAGDAEALAQAMAEALGASDEEILALGRAGKERVLRDHDMDAIAGGLKTLFEKALAEEGIAR